MTNLTASSRALLKGGENVDIADGTTNSAESKIYFQEYIHFINFSTHTKNTNLKMVQK
jgi:hypothetical protein